MNAVPFGHGTLPLVALTHPALRIALAYATTENFTGRVLYRETRAFLHPDAARAISRAADAFVAQGLTPVILDAYRPVSVQKALWAVRPDPEFVADPAVGSDHSRGIAVDITLARGSEWLDMGTAFDAAVPQSHHDRSDISAEATINRTILRRVMAEAGFAENPMEWWHYALPRGKNYPILDDTAELQG
ncbi:D-alanyl-D-alanine dipeptidase [Paenirhodobacter populi]|uniref:D-alanyl-D-alanine dipeptidase n=1 Tax=Paenirhodobacter populi TaxID=2306993 RepID=UPI000FE2F36C|nr:D-alanyl-D-alanine dipeptidase [Sinirhodobacter populi]RWR06217.1 D-alanyl-D-alanine dipeptidase [Sinirhodobacter populi]